MIDFKKWRVTGPDGFEKLVEHVNEYGALQRAQVDQQLSPVTLMRQAGYRAEPIEEPKMVTVRAEDVEALISAEPRSRADVHDALCRLRAAVEAAK